MVKTVAGIEAPGERKYFRNLKATLVKQFRKEQRETEQQSGANLPEAGSKFKEMSQQENLALMLKFNPQMFSFSTFTMATALPFVSGPQISTMGPLIGKGMYGSGPFRFDPWEMYKANKISSMSAVLLGAVGEGKSSLAKSIALRFLLHGRKLAVMTDSKGEWTDVVQRAGGSVIEVGPGRPARINPLDPGTRPSRMTNGDPMTDEGWKSMVRSRRMSLLKTLIGILILRDLESTEHSALSHALDASVGKYGTEHVVLPHLVEFLRSPDPDMDPSLRRAYLNLSYALDRTKEGDLAGMFDGPTTVSFDASKPAVSVDTSALSGASAEAKRIVSACVGNWVEAMVTNPDGGQRLCVYEEGWDNINSEADLERMVVSWKLARHYGIFNLLVIHKLGDLNLAGDSGSRMNTMAQSLLADAGIKIVYRQDESELKHLADKLGLSDRECDIVRSLKKGQGLWRINQDSYCVENVLTAAEKALLNTDKRIVEGLADEEWDEVA
ncbi:conjugal transfer protein TraC [Glutamicibacter ardleyensis]|uniref:conjugal transfer protein TraC n=1 Tax=Glutamicibacter ardleyensis TaxID=225894 RepID=UPI003FD00D5D